MARDEDGDLFPDDAAPQKNGLIDSRADAAARIASIDKLPPYEMTQRCKRERCKSKNGKGPRMIGTRAEVYCAMCPDRVFVYNPTKEEIGLQRGAPRVRPDLPFGSRDRIFAIDFYRCQLCGRTPTDDHVRLEIGHITSVADWKTSGLAMELVNADDNLVTQCFDCNQAWLEKSLPPELRWRIIRGRLSRDGLPVHGR